MLCKNCGNEIADGAKFCASCGAIAESESQAYDHVAINDFISDDEKVERAECSNKILIFGILSVAFSCTFWLGIVGWILGSMCKKKVKEYEARFGPVSGKARVGKYLGTGGKIAGMVFTIIEAVYALIYVAYILFYVVIMGAMAYGFSGLY